MIKDLAKKAIAHTFSKFSYPLIVNSYGRSGSTILTQSIIKGAIETKNDIIKDIAYRSIAQYAWDLDSAYLQNGIVYKSHDYPPDKDLSNSNVKMIYTFANPVDVVLSLLRLYDERGVLWMKEHYSHLKVPYTNFGNIKNEDQLQLEYHLNSWLSENRFPIAFVKYERMWDFQEEISDFLGFEINLPAFEKRNAQKIADHSLRMKVKKVYRPLIKKINDLDDFFIN